MVIGIQFLATVLSRGYAGHLTDLHGGKHSALRGAAISATAGALYLAAAMPVLSPNISLALIFVGRLIAGLGESLFVTGCVSWSIASVGPQRAGMSMSWTGIAMFAALAIGAPIGMGLYRAWGLETAMMACVLAPAVGGVIALREHPYATPPGPRLPFHKVISQIWREGAGLMLQGVGLSGLTAFASLYFAARHWDNAGFVMTAFGVGFIFVRVVFGSLPDKVSGYRVALWSMHLSTCSAQPALSLALCSFAPPAFRKPNHRSIFPAREIRRSHKGDWSCPASLLPVRPPALASWRLGF